MSATPRVDLYAGIHKAGEHVEHALVASIPPEALMEALHGFISALYAGERADLQQGLQAPAVDAVPGIAERKSELRALGRGLPERLAA